MHAISNAKTAPPPRGMRSLVATLLTVSSKPGADSWFFVELVKRQLTLALRAGLHAPSPIYPPQGATSVQAFKAWRHNAYFP